MEAKKSAIGYLGKMKTGSAKSKLNAPKPKAEKVTKPTTFSGDKKPRKSKDRMDRIGSILEHTPDFAKSKSGNESIPTWIKESSEQKNTHKPRNKIDGEQGESKLQWRKETKKSQRSFSKNKERDYLSGKSGSESTPSDARGGFRNTFDKDASYQSSEAKSSWDPRSKKPGTGFEKSKTGYKGVLSAWDKSTAPRVPTRTWDDESDKHQKSSDAPKRIYTKSESTKTTPAKITKEQYKKPRYIAPKPTWETESDNGDKKNLKDPTK